MKKTIGWALKCSPIVIMFFFILHVAGMQPALITCGLAVGIIGPVSLGVYLTFCEDDDV